jgi:hypothetical protein
MHVEQIIEKYELPNIDREPEEKLVIINVNNIQDRSSVHEVYEQVRGHWKISVKRAEKADYIIAALRGVAIGIFTAHKWKKSNKIEGRYCFDGTPAPDEIWEQFIGKRGKRLSLESMKHIQNPIRYWNC